MSYYDPEDIASRYGQLSPRALERVAEQAAQAPARSAGSGAYALTTPQQVLVAPLPGDGEIVPQQIKILLFTASGIWTKPTGLSFAEAEVVAGGGGGGMATTAGGGEDSAAGGGGAGGFSYRRIDAADLGATETVTVGAAGADTPTDGGTSSFGAWCSASGGHAGSACSGGAPGVGWTPAPGGDGGFGSFGDLNAKGQGGGWGFAAVTGSFGCGVAGAGGTSVRGGGNTIGGLFSVGFGQGGVGGRIQNSSGADTQLGDPGRPGLVLVREYYGIQP